jgi:cytoskeletal protein RodZ
VATNDPTGFGANDPAAHSNYGYRGEDEAPEPVPGWRKPIALVGWCLLIAVLIGVIIWGTLELTQGSDATPPAPTTTSTTVTTAPTTATTTATTTTATTTTSTTQPTASPPPTEPTDTTTSSTHHRLPHGH